jgi:hypothetical protein
VFAIVVDVIAVVVGGMIAVAIMVVVVTHSYLSPVFANVVGSMIAVAIMIVVVAHGCLPP